MTRDAELGCRSKAVLDKLGRDLRSYFNDTMIEPAPLLLQGLLDELQAGRTSKTGARSPGRQGA